MKLRTIYWFGALLLSAAATVNAQDIPVNHRDYPTGYFDNIQAGTRVEGRPNYEWRHDGLRWIMHCWNPYACDPGPQGPPTNPYTFQPLSVGKHYHHAYPSRQIYVIAITLDGPFRVVTARITADSGTENIGRYITFKDGTEPWFEDSSTH